MKKLLKSPSCASGFLPATRHTPRVLVMIVVWLGALYCPFAQGQAPDSSLRVMSFNIRNSDADWGLHSWWMRKALCVRTIRDFHPDLVGLQEVLADQYDALKSAFPDYTLVGVAREDGHRKGEWAAVLFRTDRFELLASGTFWLAETPDQMQRPAWDAACVRICSWAKLRDKITGLVLLDANTHFDHRGVRAREESARLLARTLPELAGPKTAIILTGDFNGSETDAAYEILTGNQSAGAFRLIDSFRQNHPAPEKDEGTFHDFKGTRTGSRIDWILHSAGVQTRLAEIVHASDGSMASDHFAVTAVLEVAK